MAFELTEEAKNFFEVGVSRFNVLFGEILSDEFWRQRPWHRLSRVSQAFSIYTELFSHEPFKAALKKQTEGCHEIEELQFILRGDVFRFVRNVLAHFPLFESWDEIWFNKGLVNWNTRGQTVDTFLTQYSATADRNFAFQLAVDRPMNYVTVHFPEDYGDGKIYLKSIISEKEGVKFLLLSMRDDIFRLQVYIEQ